MSASLRKTNVPEGISVVGSEVNLNLLRPEVDEMVSDNAEPVVADVT